MVLKIAIESQIKTGTVEVLPALIVDTETAEHDFLLDSMCGYGLKLLRSFKLYSWCAYAIVK